MTAASCRAELSTTPSGLRPGSTSSCSLATWHVALMLVPPDGCDDNDVFDCGARHHAERFSTGAAPHASPQRGMRHSCQCPRCEDSGVFVGITPSGFRSGQHLELLLGNEARGTHAGASRRLRRQHRLRLHCLASRLAAFDRGSNTSCSSITRHAALMAVPPGCDDSGGFDCGALRRAERSFDSASSTAELGTTPSGLQPGSTPSCSSATWHAALMSVPPDGCDDSSVLSCGAEHHAEWTSAGQHLELLLGNVARGTHAGASRRLRRQ